MIMKILNSVFFMSLLSAASIAWADGLPLSVEVSLNGSVLSLQVSNDSDKDQEFYVSKCTPSLSFITNNPTIRIENVDVHSSSTPPCKDSFVQVTLKPSDKYQFRSEGGSVLTENGQMLSSEKTESATKSISVKLGFIYLDQNGQSDPTKAVAWSDPLEVYGP